MFQVFVGAITDKLWTHSLKLTNEYIKWMDAAVRLAAFEMFLLLHLLFNNFTCIYCFVTRFHYCVYFRSTTTASANGDRRAASAEPVTAQGQGWISLYPTNVQ